MISRSFRVKIALRIILIGLIMSAFVFTINQEKWYVATGVSALLAVGLLVELFWFVDRSNRAFRNLILALKHQDFSQSFISRYNEKSFVELEKEFREIIELYKHARLEKEVHYQYLQFIINHINIAVICYREDGSVELTNPAARALLGISNLSNLDQIRQIDKKLHDIISNLGPGDKELIKLMLKSELMVLSVFATEFKLQDIFYKLVSLQNIRSELDEQELESWQKVIRVLTHEIMNSVTPVSSLSTAINEMLRDEKGRPKDLTSIEEDDMNDMYDSLKTIEERSKGLLNFVSTYKNLTRLPIPQFRHIKVEGLLNHVSVLMKKVLDKNDIELEISPLSPELEIYADQDLIQQVLINLIINAKDAMQRRRNKKINFSAVKKNGKVMIHVKDNGPGINHDNMDKIFIPFFTTKKKGSGIGLSLARQIMRMHKGSIYFSSDDEGTVFTLEF
jgi:two-component system nitrogen regulation sensor histidine kinase NtrY